MTEQEARDIAWAIEVFWYARNGWNPPEDYRAAWEKTFAGQAAALGVQWRAAKEDIKESGFGGRLVVGGIEVWERLLNADWLLWVGALYFVACFVLVVLVLCGVIP